MPCIMPVQRAAFVFHDIAFRVFPNHWVPDAGLPGEGGILTSRAGAGTGGYRRSGAVMLRRAV